jgi:hypothetical protein
MCGVQGIIEIYGSATPLNACVLKRTVKDKKKKKKRFWREHLWV